ncbi:hypothetical protein PRVXH_000960 [Proteinivorax hydrogeniformans]|uniref:Uncharacterized protein n=1 Tax=Proteinivorax hydrogeniformans TaxID=1826727 RepID=A0AAU8HW81_9FIRM
MVKNENSVRKVICAASQALTMIEEGICIEIAVKEVSELYQVNPKEVLEFIQPE